MRQLADKHAKFRVLRRHDGVAKHLPAMMSYHPSNVRTMLERFGYIVAKPIIGTGGNGVVKIEKNGAGAYRVHYRSIRKVVPSIPALLNELNRIRRGRRYLLQQGIRLATIQGRPVDYRVKLVKERGRWTIRAVVGRVARPGLFVTNLCQGGDMLLGLDALRRTFPAALARDKKATMVGVARTCTFLLERAFPGIGALGYDFGVDRKGRVWIFEVNTKPH